MPNLGGFITSPAWLQLKQQFNKHARGQDLKQSSQQRGSPLLLLKEVQLMMPVLSKSVVISLLTHATTVLINLFYQKEIGWNERFTVTRDSNKSLQ